MSGDSYLGQPSHSGDSADMNVSDLSDSMLEQSMTGGPATRTAPPTDLYRELLPLIDIDRDGMLAKLEVQAAMEFCVLTADERWRASVIAEHFDVARYMADSRNELATNSKISDADLAEMDSWRIGMKYDAMNHLSGIAQHGHDHTLSGIISGLAATLIVASKAPALPMKFRLATSVGAFFAGMLVPGAVDHSRESQERARLVDQVLEGPPPESEQTQVNFSDSPHWKPPYNQSTTAQ